MDVTRLLAPRSIAVVGASDEPGNLGGVAVRLLQKFGYPGPVWPVHPRNETVAGLHCYRAVADLPHPADLALLAVSSGRVVDVVVECADSEIRQGVAWAGGFAEVGSEGKKLQSALEVVCRDAGFSLLGPNCLGVINTHLPLTATFASFLTELDGLLPGSISMAGQSGGLATMAHALAQRAGFGFRYTVSTGNEAVLGAADFIHSFVADPETKVIGLYLEGTRDGEQLVASLDAARQAGKPVVVLKGGGTAASARAAAAHTGALAGEARVWDAVLREYSAIQVHSLEELVDVTVFLSSASGNPFPAANGVAVVTFGGGSGVLAADQCARAGLSAPPLSDGTTARLAALVPETAAIGNPVDVTPQTFTKPEWLASFPAALEVIASDANVDAVLVQCGPMAQGGREIAGALSDFSLRSPKPVLIAWPLAPAGVADVFQEHGTHVFSEYARAIEVVARLVVQRRPATVRNHLEERALPAFDWSAFVPEPTAGLVLAEHDCHRLLRAAGLRTAPGRLARSEADAADAAAAVGFPVALKAISPAVTHRAVAGLVALGVASAEQAGAEYRRLVGRAAALAAPLDGVYVQGMEVGGLELLVSAFRDPAFGVVVSCAAGGVFTETLDDVTLERAPFGESMARALVERLRAVSAAIGAGIALDPAAAAGFIASFSQLAATAPWTRFVLEINPVMWSEKGTVAVDGLLVIEEP